MADQTIGPITAVQGETNTVAKAYSIVDGTLVGTSATLAAADTSGVDYYPVFTDLAAAEYRIVLFDSGGNALTVGYSTVAAATATYELTDDPSTSLRSTSIAYILEDTGTTIPGILGTPAGDDLAADIAAIDGGGGGGTDPTTISVVVVGAGDPGDPITIKQGSAVNLVFTLLEAPTYDTILFGMSDDSGRPLIKVIGSLDSLELTVPITSPDSIRAYGGTHSYDIFEVDGYDTETGEYTDARFIVGGDAVVLPLNLQPLGL